MKVLVLLLLVAAVFAKHEEYKGWKSYYVEPSTQDQLVSMMSMTEYFELDFLTHPSVNRRAVVLVKPQFQEIFTKALKDLGVTYDVHVSDVKAALDEDDKKIAQQEIINRARHPGKSFPYDNYQPLDVIDNYVQDVAARYPEKVTLVNAGNSFEGRPIYYLKISTTNFADTSKPVIFIEGATHAREWITPPVVTWAIHKLVENVTEPDLLDNFDWIIMPMVNPDGYAFSIDRNRFWRKTRSTDTHSLAHMCPGVDINRNYDFFWNTVGTSNNPCSDIYAGNRAFSEIETQHLNKIFQENIDRMSMYLSIHSYGSFIVYPWSHNGTLPSNGLMLHTVGVSMAEAINRVTPFQPYTVGNTFNVIGYAAAGVSADYALSIGVPYSLIYELPGFSAGLWGFVVDPRFIEPIVSETWEGIKAGARAIVGR